MKQLSRALAPLVLAIGLASVLIAYAVVANDLPERIYTPVQQEWLSYNRSRIIVQEAPTMNTLTSEGEILSAVMIGDEHIVRATLSGRYEERDRVSATLYDLDFRGDYRLAHTGESGTLIEWVFPFPANLETLHNVSLLVDEKEPEGVEYGTRGIRWLTQLEAGEEQRVEISYRAEGASSFSYSLPRERRVDVDIVASVDGLVGSESAQNYLRPTSLREFQGGEVFSWTYENLIADRDIELTLPVTLSFVQRVAELQDDFRAMSRIAPLLVIGFVASLVIAFRLSGIGLRPESYLLAGLGLALFYPLVTFLSGLVSIQAAAAFSFVIIFCLVISFLARTAGWRPVRWPAGVTLLVFLGFFSLGMLTPWRGLSLTSGGVLMAGLFMVGLSGRPAAEALSAPVEAEFPEMEDATAPEEIAPLDTSEELVHEFTLVPEPTEESREPAGPFCPFCGEGLGESFRFCPGCGQKTDQIGVCPECQSEQFVPRGQEYVHCLSCGAVIRQST